MNNGGRIAPSRPFLSAAIAIAAVLLAGIAGGAPRIPGAVAEDASPAGTPCATGDAAANEALGRAFFDAFGDGDAAVLATLLAPDYVHHWGIGEDTTGAGAAIAGIVAYAAAHTGLVYIVEDVIVAGDDVVVRWVGTGSQADVVHGVAPTGAGIAWTGINILRVECGMLAEGWSEVDHLSRLRDTGVISAEKLGSVATPEA